MKILVTGKNGQVGHCLGKLLEAQSELEYLALDREQLDITNALQVNKIVDEFKPNIIVNTAAYTAVDKAEQESELANAINRDGALNLALAANNVNAAIIHISTDYVFDGESVDSYIESDITAPQGEYGRSKLAGEIAVANACSRHIILRTAWVFSEFGKNFVKTMLLLSAERDSLGIVNDQIGGPTYAGDLAEVIMKIAGLIEPNKSFPYGIYHYSGYPYVSWYDFANEIFDLSLSEELITIKPILNPVTSDKFPTIAIRPNNSSLCMQKIKYTFSIEPSDWKVSLQYVLKKLRLSNESNRHQY